MKCQEVRTVVFTRAGRCTLSIHRIFLMMLLVIIKLSNVVMYKHAQRALEFDLFL